VTLTAEMDSTYISWPRKKLYFLLAKEKYIARLFSSLLGFDISQKLYALNDKLFAKFGLRFDIRLPSLYHVVGPSPELAGDIRPIADPLASRLQQDDPPPRKAPPPSSRGPRPESGNLGEDSSSLILDDFAELPGSFMDYGSEGEYLNLHRLAQGSPPTPIIWTGPAGPHSDPRTLGNNDKTPPLSPPSTAH
ncbi:hypothetical protein AB205_0070480, partial [Aquarana catesbeiana]